SSLSGAARGSSRPVFAHGPFVPDPTYAFSFPGRAEKTDETRPHTREGTAGVGPTPRLVPLDDRIGPSRDLYCIDLVPVPGLTGVSATFELNRVPSPFGTNVTVDGAHVYAPVLRISGLPE